MFGYCDVFRTAVDVEVQLRWSHEQLSVAVDRIGEDSVGVV